MLDLFLLYGEHFFDTQRTLYKNAHALFLKCSHTLKKHILIFVQIFIKTGKESQTDR